MILICCENVNVGRRWKYTNNMINESFKNIFRSGWIGLNCCNVSFTHLNINSKSYCYQFRPFIKTFSWNIVYICSWHKTFTLNCPFEKLIQLAIYSIVQFRSFVVYFFRGIYFFVQISISMYPAGIIFHHATKSLVHKCSSHNSYKKQLLTAASVWTTAAPTFQRYQFYDD